MIVATDVDYSSTGAQVAALGFDAWTDQYSQIEKTSRCVAGGDYKPGAFFERELPCILPVVRALCERHPVSVVIVDGYVDLGSADGEPNKIGLGGHLHTALAAAGISVAVLGVAKTPFVGAPSADVLRGTSSRPLHVTARGVDLADAARWVTQMHGGFRIPTLLRRVDHLARGYV